MAFYMFTGSYSVDSIRAMVANPQDREAAARALIEGMGGKLHGFYIAFGQSDVVAIIEMKDDVAMAACALAVGAGGALAHGATTKLLTSAEAMKAMAGAKKGSSKYKAPSARRRASARKRP
jgi:uncharacterized protein with GYD domain